MIRRGYMTYVPKSSSTSSTVSIERRLVTDGQTDIEPWHMPYYAYSLCAVKIGELMKNW